MTKPNVYIARKIPENGLEILRKKCNVKMHGKIDPPTKKQLILYAKKSDAIMTSVVENVDEDVLSANPDLKIVANYAVGFDNIDLKAAKKHNVYVSNTPSIRAAEAVAQHAMALLLCIARRLLNSDKFMRSGKYKAWDPLLYLGDDMRGKTLGIIGVGRIGTSLVKIAAKGYDMKILYNDVVPNKEIEKKYKAKRLSLNDLLSKSDYISVHVPLLPSTKHMIASKQILKMKKTAIIVNTSRGQVIREKDLYKALKSKKIAGVGLDVYEFEPNVVKGMEKLDNVILTPHTASATFEAREEMARMATDNILDVLVMGKKPRNEVNK